MTSTLAWLGVVVLHAAWLGVAAAALAAIALRWLGVDRPHARHAIALVALLAVPPAAIVAALGPPAAIVAAIGPHVAAASVVATGPALADAGSSYSLAPATPWIGLVWALGLAWGALGLVVASGRIARLRRTARPIAGDQAERLLARARRHLDYSGPVALASSAEVGVPTLLGWRRPLIVVPAAMLARAATDELEWLLVHELAHVRRADVAWSWLQALVEVALFFHPAARWLARQVRHERECCCDAAIPPRQDDLVAYVRALTRLASADRSALRPALSANGGTLVNRIERLIDPTTVIPTCSRGFCLALVLGALAGAAALSACDTEECPETEQVAALELPAESSDEQGVVAQVPPRKTWAGAVPGVKYIDEYGNEISPVGPDGKWKGIFGQFTDEHGQNFAVLMGAEWKVEKPPELKSDGVPIPFLDGVEGADENGTDGC